MKKILTLFLVLAGYVCTASASMKVYLDVTPSIWGSGVAQYVAGYWGSESGFVSFSSVENETTIYSAEFPDGTTGIKIMRKDVNTANPLDWENVWNTTGDVDDIFNGKLITITGWDTSFTSGTYTIATIDQVRLFYKEGVKGEGNYLTLTGEDHVYTGTLDLSGTSVDQLFKLLINDGGDESDGWAGWIGRGHMTIDIPNTWLSYTTNDENDNSDLQLNNSISEYQTYNITATWLENSVYSQAWTLKIEGATPRPRTYSIVGTITGDPSDNWTTDWDMEATADANVYQLVKEVELSAASYEYKLRTNHAWTLYNLPADGNNSYTFKDSGKYRLTFTANVSENTLSLSAEKIVELGTSGKGTFASNHICDFSGVEGLTAYAVSEISGDYAMLTKVTGVPNGNGVILAGSAKGKYYVPFGGAESLGSDNLLQAVTAAAGHTVENNGDAYILYTDGLFHPANAGTIPFGKAYLNKAAVGSARALSLVFDGDDITGISNIENNATANDGFYNLAGQRVAAPAKGLYIVNGKKVIIK